MVETRAELPFIGDQVGLFRAQPGRPKRTYSPSPHELQKSLKAERNVPLLACGRRSLDRQPFREAIDQRLDQLLLQPVRCFATDKSA